MYGKRSFGEKVCACGCGMTFTSTHWKMRYAHESHALKVKYAQDNARRAKLKDNAPPKLPKSRKQYHVLRMTTVRVVDGYTLAPGEDLCERLACRKIYQPTDSRQKFCGPDCRCKNDNESRPKRLPAERDAHLKRVAASRITLGLAEVNPDDREPFGAPCRQGLPADEGLDGQIPWGHSWSGADPLPA